MHLACWVCAAVALISAFVSLGYAIAGARSARGDALTPSRYALARSLALAVVAVVALFTSSIGFVAAVAGAMVIVQATDTVVGMTIKDRVKTFGPAFTSLAGLAALVWMLAS